MPLPLLPTLRGSVRQLPEPQHIAESNLRRIRLRIPLGASGLNTRLGCLQRATTGILGLGVCKWPLTQELQPPLPMKSLVFGNGLLCMACAATGEIRDGRLAGLPLLVPAEVFNVLQHATPVPALLPVRGPRPSDGDLRAGVPSVTRAHQTQPMTRVRRCYQHQTPQQVYCRRPQGQKCSPSDPIRPHYSIGSTRP